MFNKLCDTKNACYNIVHFIKNKIENEGVTNTYNWLIKIDEVGNKIAGCVLRDIIWLYNLEGKLHFTEKDRLCLVPVDTWVRQIGRNLFGQNITDKEMKKKISDACTKCKVSLLATNQGIWYIGAHAFDVIKMFIENRNFARGNRKP